MTSYSDHGAAKRRIHEISPPCGDPLAVVHHTMKRLRIDAPSSKRLDESMLLTCMELIAQNFSKNDSMASPSSSHARNGASLVNYPFEYISKSTKNSNRKMLVSMMSVSKSFRSHLQRYCAQMIYQYRPEIVRMSSPGSDATTTEISGKHIASAYTYMAGTAEDKARNETSKQPLKLFLISSPTSDKLLPLCRLQFPSNLTVLKFSPELDLPIPAGALPSSLVELWLSASRHAYHMPPKLKKLYWHVHPRTQIRGDWTTSKIIGLPESLTHLTLKNVTIACPHANATSFCSTCGESITADDARTGTALPRNLAHFTFDATTYLSTPPQFCILPPSLKSLSIRLTPHDSAHAAKNTIDLSRCALPEIECLQLIGNISDCDAMLKRSNGMPSLKIVDITQSHLCTAYASAQSMVHHSTEEDDAPTSRDKDRLHCFKTGNFARSHIDDFMRCLSQGDDDSTDRTNLVLYAIVSSKGATFAAVASRAIVDSVASTHPSAFKSDRQALARTLWTKEDVRSMFSNVDEFDNVATQLEGRYMQDSRLISGYKTFGNHRSEDRRDDRVIPPLFKAIYISSQIERINRLKAFEWQATTMNRGIRA